MRKIFLVLAVVILLMSGCSQKKNKSNDIFDDTKEIVDEINEAKRNVAKNSAYNLRHSVELYYHILLIDMVSFEEIVFTCSKDGCATENETLDLYGDAPTSGTITINYDGTFEFNNIVINGYKCNIPKTGTITCS